MTGAIIKTTRRNTTATSEQLTLEIGDETYATLQKKADAVGLSAAEWLLELANSQKIELSNSQEAQTSTTQDAAERPRKSFKDYAGAIKEPVDSINNEDIDADG